ncbi:MAG: pseudouridine synthase [Planctomycetota bacterium]
MGKHSKKKTLDRALCLLGHCSRSQAQTLIREGRVKVNGRVVRDPDQWVDLHGTPIELDDKHARPQAPVYLALHKPRGILTTRHDPQGRKTIYDVLGPMGTWVAPAGRLDADTSGLILLTNDSPWAAEINRPHSISKVYKVKARGSLDETSCQSLLKGVELQDGLARALDCRILSSGKSFSLLSITINEGRNRMIRRMVAALGSKVLELKRLSIGGINLEDLASGHWRHLTLKERESLA